jgi:hypothetical protein
MGVSYELGFYYPPIPMSEPDSVKMEAPLQSKLFQEISADTINHEIVRARVDWSGGGLLEDKNVSFKWYNKDTGALLYTYNYTFKKGWTWSWVMSWIGHKSIGEIDRAGNYYVDIECPGLFSKRLEFVIKEAAVVVPPGKSIFNVYVQYDTGFPFQTKIYFDHADIGRTKADGTMVIETYPGKHRITATGVHTGELWQQFHDAVWEGDIKDAEKKEVVLTMVRKAPLPEAEKTWQDKLIDIVHDAGKNFLATVGTEVLGYMEFFYEAFTGKEFDPLVIEDFVLDAADWWPMTNFMLVVMTGTNTKGEPQTYPNDSDWVDLLLLLMPFGVEWLTKYWARVGVQVGADGMTKIGVSYYDDLDDIVAAASKSGVPNTVVKSVGEKIVETRAAEILKVTTPSNLAAKGILSTLLAEAKAHPLLTFLSSAMLITQMDVTGWGFGLLPQQIHSKAETSSKAIRGDLIRLQELIENKDWEAANKLVPVIRMEISDARANLKGAPASFWEHFGFKTEDMDSIFDALEISLDSYVKEFPSITVEKIAFPKEFTLTSVKVEDGDTLEFPKHPEVQSKIRFLGIDAHESGTEAGKKEMNYLKSLIEGKTVTIRVDEWNEPAKLIDSYGRLLGGVFINGEDVALKMLSKFGTGILTETKNQKKYWWIDWDEYTKTAKASVGTKGKVRVSSKPSSCKIYIDQEYTHHYAPETFELEEGTYVFGASKTGYVADSEVVILKAGDDIEVRFELEETTLEEKAPEEGVPEKEAKPEFKIYVTSKPSNAKLYIDGEYTRHWTPADEKELKDVLELLSPGAHTLKVTKAGMEAEQQVQIVEGDNGTITLQLETVGLPPAVPEIPEEVPATPPKEEIVVPELPPLSQWTPEMFALAKAILDDVEAETIGAKQLSTQELEDLRLKYGVYKLE